MCSVKALAHNTAFFDCLIKHFRESRMKISADKFRLFESSEESCTAQIKDFIIKNSTEEKLLGVKFGFNFSFQSHVTSLCQKADQKLFAFVRISRYMDITKDINLMEAFITSHFCYCPFICMFDSCNLNNKINRIHKRAIRIVLSE